MKTEVIQNLTPSFEAHAQQTADHLADVGKMVGLDSGGEREDDIRKATAKHNEFLRELGLPLLRTAEIKQSSGQ